MPWLSTPMPLRWMVRFADYPSRISNDDFIHIWRERIICNTIREFGKQNPGKPFEVQHDNYIHDNRTVLKVRITELREIQEYTYKYLETSYQ
jgi:hypothetical protein